MRAIVAGEPEAAAAAAASARERGIEVVLADAVEAGAEADPVARLARLLVELERAMVGSRPDLVIAADRSDRAFAAALCAAKLAIAVAATPGAVRGEGANGRLIAQLVTDTDLDLRG